MAFFVKRIRTRRWKTSFTFNPNFAEVSKYRGCSRADSSSLREGEESSAGKAAVDGAAVAAAALRCAMELTHRLRPSIMISMFGLYKSNLLPTTAIGMLQSTKYSGSLTELLESGDSWEDNDRRRIGLREAATLLGLLDGDISLQAEIYKSLSATTLSIEVRSATRISASVCWNSVFASLLGEFDPCRKSEGSAFQIEDFNIRKEIVQQPIIFIPPKYE